MWVVYAVLVSQRHEESVLASARGEQYPHGTATDKTQKENYYYRHIGFTPALAQAGFSSLEKDFRFQEGANIAGVHVKGIEDQLH